MDTPILAGFMIDRPIESLPLLKDRILNDNPEKITLKH
jgi:hypothetical protein